MENDLRRPGESDWEAFERGVDAALASAPKPKVKRQTFEELLVELRFLFDKPGCPRDAIYGVTRVLQQMDKLVVIKPQVNPAAITKNLSDVLQCTDLFVDYVRAFRAGNWPLVSVIEHKIISSS